MRSWIERSDARNSTASNAKCVGSKPPSRRKTTVMRGRGRERAIRQAATPRSCCLQRQITDLPLPLAFETTFNNQKQIVDHGTKVQPGADLKDAGHGPSCPDAVVRVFRDCCRNTRLSLAAQSRTAASSAPESPASWTRKMSRSGFRRIRPRTISLLKFSSAASRSTTARGYRRRARRRSRTPDGLKRCSFCSRTCAACC